MRINEIITEGLLDLFKGKTKTQPGQLKPYMIYDGFTIYWDPAPEVFVVVGTGEYQNKFPSKGFPAHAAMGGLHTAEMYGQKMTGGKLKDPIKVNRDVFAAQPHEDLDLDVDEAKATRELCTSGKPDSALGASNLASCKSQGYRSREGGKTHKVGHERIKVRGKKIKGKKYGGPLPDWT